MGKSQSKASGKTEKKGKGKNETDGDPAHGNPIEETATPTFDRPARVQTLTSPTKYRPKANSARRPPTRSGRATAVAWDANRDQPGEIEDGKAVANGPSVIGSQRDVENIESQDVATMQEKRAPSIKPKPKAPDQSMKEKSEEDRKAFESPRTKVRSNLSADAQIIQELETNAKANGKSPTFVPDVSDSPRTPRLPRVTLTASPASSPSRERSTYDRSQSEPEKRPKSPRLILEKSVSVEPSTQSLQMQTNLTFFEYGRRTPTGSRSGTASPERNRASPAATRKKTPPTTTASTSSSGRGTPVLPRLAFDHVTVGNIIDNNLKRHKRAKSERSIDVGFLENKKRRNSFDEQFQGQLNALLTVSNPNQQHSSRSRKDGDFPSPSPKRFHTPQPERRGTGPTIKTEL